jgi:transposase
MKTTVSRSSHYNQGEGCLYMALELSEKQWKLGFSIGPARKPRLRTIAAGDRAALRREIGRAKERFGLPDEAPVRSCYEAGRDGFWIHRLLLREGIDNRVVDSSSIEVNRQARRAKSDGLDVRKLTEMLMRYWWGEKRVWRVVHVPGRPQEDDRHLHRGLKTLRQDRTATAARIRGLLKTQGIRWSGSIERLSEERLEELRDWEGRELGAGLKRRVAVEIRLCRVLSAEIQALERQRREMLRREAGGKLDQVRRLESLKGIGVNGAWTLVMEAFGWREFRNRREVGGFLGMTPSPYQSGTSSYEQGITKAGNQWCRDLIAEVAWAWVRYQPHSELTRWFQRRFAEAGPRARKIGIVALARKLVIQLWQFIKHGVEPAGTIYYCSSLGASPCSK